MVRYAFVTLVLAIVLPLAITSVLSDMNRRKVAGLVAVVVACVGLVPISRTPLYAGTQAWLSVGLRVPLLGVAVLLLIIGAALSGPLLRRRAASTLDWPATITQADMQRLGSLYLERRGWSVSADLPSFAGLSIFRCRKDRLRMFAVFVRHPIAFDRLLKNLSTTPGLPLRNVVLVYYGPIPETLRKTAVDEGFSAINYRELGGAELLCAAVAQSHAAKRALQFAR